MQGHIVTLYLVSSISTTVHPTTGTQSQRPSEIRKQSWQPHGRGRLSARRTTVSSPTALALCFPRYTVSSQATRYSISLRVVLTSSWIALSYIAISWPSPTPSAQCSVCYICNLTPHEMPPRPPRVTPLPSPTAGPGPRRPGTSHARTSSHNASIKLKVRGTAR